MRDFERVPEDKDVEPPASSADQDTKLNQLGWGLTGIYLFFLICMAIVARNKLFELDPNEFGDMLAGVFAPLAFLWLVLGFYQQGKELKASVAALKLQGRELRNSVIQQRELVAVSREHLQSEIEAINQQRSADEFAAQPVLVPCNGKAFPVAGGARFEIGFSNAGARATNVVLRGPGGPILEREVLATGERFMTRLSYPDRADIKGYSGYVEYYDARGNRRARAYTYPLDPGGDNGEQNSLGDGQVHQDLYSPPFPWDPKD